MEVVVKNINSDTLSETINKEICFTNKLEIINGFSKIYYTYILDKKNVIVESLLGSSIDKLFKYFGKIFPFKNNLPNRNRNG